jgi:hypothetical protein
MPPEGEQAVQLGVDERAADVDAEAPLFERRREAAPVGLS